MATEIDARRSRRSLLMAALGAGAAAVAGALGRPAATSATDGNQVLVGGTYTASAAGDLLVVILGRNTLRITPVAPDRPAQPVPGVSPRVV